MLVYPFNSTSTTKQSDYITTNHLSKIYDLYYSKRKTIDDFKARIIKVIKEN
jgi:hypothetical protein